MRHKGAVLAEKNASGRKAHARAVLSNGRRCVLKQIVALQLVKIPGIAYTRSNV